MAIWTDILLLNALGATLLAGVVALVSIRIRRPAVLHVLWLIVLLKLVAVPALEVSLVPTGDDVRALFTEARVSPSIASPTTSPIMASGTTPPIRPADHPGTGSAGVASGEAPAARLDHARPGTILAGAESGPRPPLASAIAPRWIFLLVAGLGTLAILGLTIYRVVRFQRRLRQAPAAPPELQARAEGLARAMGLSRAPRIRVVPDRMTPSLWPLGACQILLPAPLLRGLSDPERDSLILHELAHVRRRDHWIRPLELLVVALYWWLPVVWWARRQLRATEERACDALVVNARPGETREYAEALVKTVEFLSARDVTLPRLATGAGEPNRLEERVTMILTQKPSAGLPSRLRPALLTIALLSALVTPGWVKDAADPDDDTTEKEEQLVEEHRRQVEKQHHLEMLAIQHQELDLQRQLQELESSRVRMQLEYETGMLQAEEIRVREEAARLREDGLEEDALALEQDLQRMQQQMMLHRERVEFEQQLGQQRMEIEFQLQELTMERERLMVEGEPERADALLEQMQAVELQYRQLEIEALRGEISHTEQRLQQEMMWLEQQNAEEQK